MEISWLEDFLALVELEHFSRAAERRHVTQPAFSRRIRSLEEWMGEPLFDRTTHQVHLTEAGRQFQPIATKALRQLIQGRETVRAAGSREAGILVVAATHALSFTFFPEWLGVLESHVPVGSVRLISDSMQACEQVLGQGHAHFLLCHHHPAAPIHLDAATIRSMTIGHDTLVLAATPALAEQAASGLDGLPYLGYSAASGLGRIVAAVQAQDEHGPRQPPALTSHLAVALRNMARRGRGMAWLPLSMIQTDLSQDGLRIIETDVSRIEVGIQLVRPRARQSCAAESVWAGLRAQLPAPCDQK
jgi:DNA-binding transcriptional LysR family regulator